MESTVNLDMEDIFEEEEDIPSLAPLPDLPEHEEAEGMADNNDEDAENSEVLSKLKDLSKGAAKRVVRKPQPKLDSTRLTGDRGIPILPNVFKDVKFKGNGHEAQDLGIVMRYLEHWTHRLFPKMPFDEVLERIEKLGTKKEVQTCIKKMRLDMPILSSDFVDDEEEETKKQLDLDPDGEEVWDEMLRQEDQRVQEVASTPGHTSQLVSELNKPLTPSMQLTNGTRLSAPSTPTTPTNNGQNSPITGGLTPEQRERIEKNKRLAMEKRFGRSVFKVPATPSATGSPIRSPASSPSKAVGTGRREKSMVTGNGDVVLGESNHDLSQENSVAGATREDSTSQESESMTMSEIIPFMDDKPASVSADSMNSDNLSEVVPFIDKTVVNQEQQRQTGSLNDTEYSDMSEVIPVVGQEVTSCSKKALVD